MTREARSRMEELQGIVVELASSASSVAGDLELAAGNSRAVKARSGEILESSRSAAEAASIVSALGQEIKGGMGEIEIGSRDTGAAGGKGRGRREGGGGSGLGRPCPKRSWSWRPRRDIIA